MAKKKRKLYVLSDCEFVYATDPDNQESSNNPAPITSMRAALKLLKELREEDLYAIARDEPPVPDIHIYELKLVK